MSWFKMLFAVLLLSILCGGAAFAKEEHNGTFGGGIDAVIIVDTSSSMWQADAERIAIEGAKRFVDMLPTSGSRIGVVAFRGYIHEEVPLTEDKDFVKKKMDELTYDVSDKSETDMGMALEKGVSLLENGGDIGNKQMILFFTDGAIDFNGTSGRTYDDSIEDIQEAVEEIEKEYPIFGIGLNNQKNPAIQEAQQRVLQYMAENTWIPSSQQPGKCYLIQSSSELNSIYGEILELVGSVHPADAPPVVDGVITVNIPDDHVLESNLTMFSDTKLDITIQNPNGETVKIDNKQIIKSQSKSYTLLKLVYPEEGEWKFDIGDKNNFIDTELIFTYDVVLVQEVDEAKTYAAGDIVPVSAHFASGTKTMEDAKFMKDMKATATVTDPDQIDTAYEMRLNQDNQYETDFKADKAGAYMVSIRVDGKNFYRATKPLSIKVQTDALKMKADAPKSLEISAFFKSGAKENLDLDQWFGEEEQNVLTYDVETDGAILEAKINEKDLQLEAVAKGDTLLTLRATNGSGSTSELKIPVNVDYQLESPLILILGAVLVLLLIGGGFFFLTHRPGPKQMFIGTIQYAMENGIDPGCGGQGTCSLMGLRGIVKLDTVIVFAGKQQMELKKITMKPYIKKETGEMGIALHNSSKNIKCRTVATENGNVILLNRDVCEYEQEFTEGDITLTIRYEE